MSDVEIQAVQEAAEGTRLAVIPRLPDWLDKIVGVLLLIFPVVVIGSWITMNTIAYNKSKEKREEYEREKIRKAVQLDAEEDPEEAAKKAAMKVKRRRRRKLTAFEESIMLEEEEKMRNG